MIVLPRTLRLPRIVDLFTPLLFLYFLTLHADALHIKLGGTIRFNNMLAFALVFLLMLRLRFDFFRVEKWLCWGVAAIIFSVFLSLFFTPHLKRCILHTFWFGLTLLCYLWMPYQLFTKFDRERFLKLFFAAFVVVGFYAFCQLFTGPWLKDPYVNQSILPGLVGRPNACCYEPSYYALYMTPFIFHQTFLYLCQDESVSGRYLFVITLFYFVSASAGALCSYAIFVCLALFYRKCWKRLFPLILKVSTFMLPVFLIGGAIAFNFFLKQGKGVEHYSVGERWSGIEHCLILFKQRPLLGYGLGGVAPERIEQNLYLEKYKQMLGGASVKEAEPTSIGSEILASLGLVGGVAFSLLIGLYIVHHFKWRHSLRQDAFFISVVVMLITWQFSQSLMRPYCWTYFAIAAAFLRNQSTVSAMPKSKGVSLNSG